MHLETPCFLFETFVALHVGDTIEVLLHLLAQTYVKTIQVCKASDTEIKMKDMILVGRKEFSQEGSLSQERSVSDEKCSSKYSNLAD